MRKLQRLLVVASLGFTTGLISCSQSLEADDCGYAEPCACYLSTCCIPPWMVGDLADVSPQVFFTSDGDADSWMVGIYIKRRDEYEET